LDFEINTFLDSKKFQIPKDNKESLGEIEIFMNKPAFYADIFGDVA